MSSVAAAAGRLCLQIGPTAAMSLRQRIAIAASVALTAYSVGGTAFIAAQIVKQYHSSVAGFDLIVYAACPLALCASVYFFLIAPEQPRGSQVRTVSSAPWGWSIAVTFSMAIVAIIALLFPSELSRLMWRIDAVVSPLAILLYLIWRSWAASNEILDTRSATQHDRAGQ